MSISERAYQALADVYDIFMDDVDYDAWARVIVDHFQKHGIRDGLVCDLACGTGKMTELLSEAGYDMIGVDASVDMLGVAQKKQFRRAASRGEAAEPDILYLHQDMRAFELYGTVRAIVSVCDSINYITEKEELLSVFKLVNNYLDPGGIFIFDHNLPEKYAKIGEDTIAENRREGSFIWQNHYDEATKINLYDLTLFLPEKDGRFRKFEERHVQRAWTSAEIEEAVREAGMELLESCPAYDGDDADRLMVVAREKGKQK